jgi:S1-C subfamily serine protease
MDIERQVQETFSNHYKSVVLIRRGSDGIGTGFIIGKTRKSYVAMTCYHVISGNPSGALKVRLPRDTKDYVAELLYEHQGYDLAIIKVNGVSGECPILQFGDLEGVAHRANVVQLGYILGSQFALNLDPSVSPGSVM